MIFNINQSTNEVSIINEGVITADSQGTGSGGQIFIRAKDLTLDNLGKIVAITSSLQDENTETPSGDISLGIDNKLTLRKDSLISAQALNNADGGNININTEFLIAFPSEPDGNDIIASAEGGDGGNIRITAEEIFGLQEGKAIPGNGTNDIDASSEFGFDGSVSIQTPDVNSIQPVVRLSSNIVKPDDYVTQVCSVEQIASSSNSLVIKGRGGIPLQPTEALNADSIIIGGKYSPIESENRAQTTPEKQYPPIATDEGDIYPARGVVVQEDGTIVLTAYPVSNDSQRTLVASQNCQANR